MVLNLHEEVRRNKRKSILVVILFYFFIAFLGASTGAILSLYKSGNFNIWTVLFITLLALAIGILYSFVFLKSGDRMILNIANAKEASRTSYPFLYHTTEALSIAAGLKTPPKCYIIEDDSLNAFATGFKPEKSYVVVTTGLIKKLNRQELEGVLAHEISHIKNQDIKLMLLVAGLLASVVLLSDILFRMFIHSLFYGSSNEENNNKGFVYIAIFFWILLIILSPIVAELIKLAISRKREFLADSTGALLTRYPEGLASALEKIKNEGSGLKHINKATAHLFIANPLKSKSSFFKSLFSTHPPIDERIKRLRGLKV